MNVNTPPEPGVPGPPPSSTPAVDPTPLATPRPSTAIPLAVGIFALGLIAIVAYLVWGDAPVWIGWATTLTPIGFIVGVAAAFRGGAREARFPK